MTILVVGASGATGKLLVNELITQGEKVKIIVRETAILSEIIKTHENVTIIKGDILKLSEDELKLHVKGCRAIVSCLGHNISLKGVFGHPRRLVTLAVERLCLVSQQVSSLEPVKFILMNSTGNKNTLANEKTSIMQSLVIGCIRHLVPPHADNEQAAKYLQSKIGTDNQNIQWVVLRPDSLTDEINVSPYSIYPSPIRSAFFDAGKTSRINVAHFMSRLISNAPLWDQWHGKMPVIYNSELNLMH
jgi:nucleoside-diphosphate-sugar epimerase